MPKLEHTTPGFPTGPNEAQNEHFALNSRAFKRWREPEVWAKTRGRTK